MRQKLLSFVSPVVEAVTLVLLVVRKRLTTGLPIAHPLNPDGKQHILVIAAHPDDETIGCFGAILRHRQAGDSVRVLMVTDGSGSRAGGLSPEQMASARRGEVARLQLLLRDVQIEQLGLVENNWKEGDLGEVLLQTLQDQRPDIIYAPSCVDFHPEHIKVGKTLAFALASLPQDNPPLIRAYEMQVPLGIELVNLYSPLGEHRETKEHAIALYKSQGGALGLWRRQARYLGALYSAQGGAEAFWEMSAPAYCRIMDYAHWDWRTTPFRSLKGRPFWDLPAHLTGRRTRLVLRNLSYEANPYPAIERAHPA